MVIDRVTGDEPKAFSCIGVVMAELVVGLGNGEDTTRRSLSYSEAFLLFEAGRGGVDSCGLAKTNPVAATPTVLEATSYLHSVSTSALLLSNALLQECFV